MKSEKSASDYLCADYVLECEDIPTSIYLRKVTIYCCTVFNTFEGTAKTFTFINSDKCLEVTLLFRCVDKGVHVHTFTDTIHVMPGHPLYKWGVPLVTSNSPFHK